MKRNIIPIIIISLSFFKCFDIISKPSDIYAILSVIIGVIGVVLYYKKEFKTNALIYIWAYFQIPNIFYVDFTGTEIYLMRALPISLPLELSTGLQFHLPKEVFYLQINVISFAFPSLFKFIEKLKKEETKD